MDKIHLAVGGNDCVCVHVCVCVCVCEGGRGRKRGTIHHQHITTPLYYLNIFLLHSTGVKFYETKNFPANKIDPLQSRDERAIRRKDVGNELHHGAWAAGLNANDIIFFL